VCALQEYNNDNGDIERDPGHILNVAISLLSPHIVAHDMGNATALCVRAVANVSIVDPHVLLTQKPGD
jgi:hypothetical protein